MRSSPRSGFYFIITLGVVVVLVQGCSKDAQQDLQYEKIGSLYGGGIIYNRSSISSWINGQPEGYIYDIAALNDISCSVSWEDSYVLCRDFTSKGYSDWTRPAPDDLKLMYKIKEPGGFSDGIYWSALKKDSCLVYCFDFRTGKSCLLHKDSLACVRPVREEIDD